MLRVPKAASLSYDKVGCQSCLRSRLGDFLLGRKAPSSRTGRGSSSVHALTCPGKESGSSGPSTCNWTRTALTGKEPLVGEVLRRRTSVPCSKRRHELWLFQSRHGGWASIPGPRAQIVFPTPLPPKIDRFARKGLPRGQAKQGPIHTLAL
jgi:hypothetical protein